MTSLYELLIKSIIKNKVYLSDFTFINKDMVNFIDFSNNKEIFFNTYQQVHQIQKVYIFLKGLVKKNKSILFFGFNKAHLSEIEDIVGVSSFNKEIFKLCFSILTLKHQVSIEQKIENFYDSIYIQNKDYKDSEIIAIFEDFEDFIKLAIQKKYIAVNGQFFDCWNEGMASNYHWFNSLLKKSLNDDAPEYAIILNNFMITDRFQNFKSISLALGRGRKMPGAVVFFSRIGYEYFFPEFKKFGVPIICIVNSNESIKDIDFPLIGDNSLCSVNYFYLRIIRLALIKNFK
jgi:hypothetical protein